MKLYVPEIGDHLQLTADWSFDLYNEHRNKSVWDLYDCENDPVVQQQKQEKNRIKAEINALESKIWPRGIYARYPLPPSVDDVAKRNKLYDQLHKLLVVNITIPAGSVLAIDRIFIRKGLDDWSSLTFYLKHHPDRQFKKKPRFWAKLHDCNKIEFVQHSS